MSWEIRLLDLKRDESLVDLACAESALPEKDDRLVLRELVVGATLAGDHSVGDLFDRLEAAGPAGCRPILDNAREAAGLPRTEDLDRAERFEALQRQVRRRAAKRPIPTCAVCGVHPTGPGGFPVEVPRVRKWHCAEHVAQAQPGDMDPPPLPLDLNFRELDPDEIAREQRKDERRRQDWERRQRERQAEREAISRARERYEEHVAEDDYARPPIAGIRGARMDAG
jgi:hypothetical protein